MIWEFRPYAIEMVKDKVEQIATHRTKSVVDLIERNSPNRENLNK